jgi:uncharacterized protein (DUF2147 family)
MKRISVALLLMLLSSTAHARGYSFAIGGHHIYIDAGRHCRSLSCVSWSDSRTRHSYRDGDEAAGPAPAKPVAVAPACPPVAAPAAAVPVAPETAAPRAPPAPVAPPMPAPLPAPVRAQVAPQPVAPAPLLQPAPVQVAARPAPMAQAQAPSAIELAAANAQTAPRAEVVVGKPKEKATVEATVADKPVEPPDWAKDWSPKDTPAPKPTQVVAHEDDSPLGDWQTEGKKGLVRIEKCGAALCGYLLNETANTMGETVLSNMKAKTDAHWAGDIYSRASGNTYYAKMTFKQPDTLRVEACAIGRFFCSGNDWTRVPRSDEVVTSRNLPAPPKS